MWNWNDMQLQSHQPLGYSLIEIIVAVTIISLVFTFGYAGFREYSRRQLLVSAARSLQGELRLAQGYSLSGKKPTGCTVLDGYRVKISATTYSLVAVCAKINEISINKDDLPIASGVTASATKNIFTFKALGQGTDMGVGTSSVITLTQTATGRTQTITVSASGEIK